jgi:hypothetical protein
MIQNSTQTTQMNASSVEGNTNQANNCAQHMAKLVQTVEYKNTIACKCRKINIRKSRNVHQIDETSGSEEEEYVLTAQTNDSREDIKAIDKDIFPKKIFATMRIDRNEIKFQLDCGSTVNVLPEYLFRQFLCEKEHVEIEKSSQTLAMFNGTETKPLGKK